MKDNHKHWVTHPSKKTLFIFITLWFIGNGLLLMTITDLFSKKPDFFSPLTGLIGSSTAVVFGLILTYFKNKNVPQEIEG